MVDFIKRYKWLFFLHLLGLVTTLVLPRYQNAGFLLMLVTFLALLVVALIALFKSAPASRNTGKLLIPEDFPQAYKPYVLTCMDKNAWGSIAYHAGLAVPDADAGLVVHDLEAQRRGLRRHANGGGGTGMAVMRAGYVLGQAQKYKRQQFEIMNQPGMHVVGNSFYRVPIFGDFLANEIGPEICFLMPDGLFFEDFVKAAPAVAEALRVDSVVFHQDALARQHRAVWMRIVLNDPLEISEPADTPFSHNLSMVVLGKRQDGRTATLDITNNSGMVVGGVPGSGKSAGLTAMLYPLVYNENIEFSVVDGKGGMDWKWIEPRAKHFINEEDSLAEVLEVLHEFDNERKLRNKQIYESRGSSNFWDKGPDREFPLKLLVMDEVQMYLDPNQYAKHEKEEREQVQQIQSLVAKLIRMGRTAGIFVILATQKPTADSIPTAIRDNTGIRVSFRVETTDSAVAILGNSVSSAVVSPMDIPMERRGQAVLKLENSDFEMIRFSFIDGREAEEHVKAYCSTL